MKKNNKNYTGKIAGLLRQKLGYFNLLPFFTATQILLAEVFTRMISQYSKVKFSQTGEEFIINNFLQQTVNGFYIEVGCNEPVQLSNTFSLYLNGWRGICIDANEEIIKKFARTRKKDITVCAAVSETEKEMAFHRFKQSAVGTLEETVLEEWKTNWDYEGKQMMQTRTLTSILDEYLPSKNQPIHLLSIDVEGHDFNVLKSLDFTKYRPTLVVVELHSFDILKMKEHPVWLYMNEQGYKLVNYATMNGYFQDESVQK